nr:hypothetical protein [Actinomycetota bacterium]
MANLLWLFGGSRLLRAVRDASRMTAQEFADALGDEVGWMVPTDLLLEWEEGRHEPPRHVERAARRLAARAESPVGAQPEVNRREFLSRASLLGGLIVLDPSMPAPAGSGRDGGSSALDIEALSVPRASETTVSTFWEVVATYRLAYGSTSAEKLMPRLAGLIPVLLDMQESLHSAGLKQRGTSLLGQTAVMAGLLSLMGRHDLPAARDYYELALTAAKESSDANLLAYAYGSMSFHDVRAGRLGDGLQRIMAADGEVRGDVSPITSAWLASLGSELYA